MTMRTEGRIAVPVVAVDISSSDEAGREAVAVAAMK